VTLANEFDRIARHFRPLAGPAALDLGDDAALLDPPPGLQLVVSADAMVAGVHFLPGDPPDLVARKLLRANLSDLAAMGADPLGYLLTVSVARDTPEAWFAAFSAGLAADQAEFGISLLGGDTTSTSGPVSLSLTIIGTVPRGEALRRGGARPGDDIWVSGTIGDGALGLLAAQGTLADPDGFLADRYRLPRPRLALGRTLRGVATACLDVSDGLVQDVGHLCRAAGLGAVIEAGWVPLSAAAATAGAEHFARCLTGGDDYELAFAAPAAAAAAVRAAGIAVATPVTVVGRFAAGDPGVQVRRTDGTAPALASAGWDHFA